MTDLTATVSLNNIVDLKFDQTSGLLYLTTSDGILARWDPQTSSLLSSVNLGGNLGGFDITPDGRYALVAHTNTNGTYAEEIDRVDLSSLAAQRLNLSPSGPAFYEGGASDLAIGSGGIALATTNFQGSGWTPLRQFASEDPTIAPSLVSGLSSVRGGSYLTSSENHRYILIQEDNTSNAPPGGIRFT